MEMNVTVKGPELVRALKALTPLAGKDALVPVLHGIHVTDYNGTLVFEATDRYVLGMVKVATGDDQFGFAGVDFTLTVADAKAIIADVAKQPHYPLVLEGDVLRYGWSGRTAPVDVSPGYPAIARVVTGHLDKVDGDKKSPGFNVALLAAFKNANGKHGCSVLQSGSGYVLLPKDYPEFLGVAMGVRNDDSVDLAIAGWRSVLGGQLSHVA